MKILKWIKEKIENNSNKKLITNLLVLLCAGIVMVISGNFFRDISLKSKGGYNIVSDSKDTELKEDHAVNEYNYEKGIEEQLAYILSKVDSAGKVSVMITYKTSKELIVDKNNTINDRVTNENDNDGGTRVINELDTNENTVVINEQGGNSKVIITKEINPEIKGVIVVSKGAKDVNVKRKLTDAVQTILDIPAYRVMVLETE